ncbi:uncharacterized protein A4U43_C02F7370 [Asparagus officinalis]|uniref:C2H2-type domain-containing protein n=1 Tax=Asparagus officinalis TaxID=4686 RepID=A0A5P1FHH6_ASPOF|nr:uncharacterized protein LOC109829425 [Asparagus officinalis]ONK77514.1 uncharacterized protein A4U43_C02F7370 [Asparagus officinalis]
MPPPIERSKISKAPIQLSSPLSKSMDSRKPTNRNSRKSHKQGFRSFFSCKYHETAVEVEKKKKKKIVRKIGWSSSLCNSRESSKVMQENCENVEGTSSSSSSFSASSSNNNLSVSITSSSSSSSLGGPFRGMHLRKFSGCYESNGVSKVPSLVSGAFPCSDCGEIFTKSVSLEVHQAVKHAVSELESEGTSCKIVEIIFKSSWLKEKPPTCKIERILKIRHSQKTFTEFESYRDSIKTKANKLTRKHQRCIADGNELLRFYCTSFSCFLGHSGSTGLCISVQSCKLCSIIKDGFKLDELGKIRTMATSGQAHDAAKIEEDGEERAMLVCRVIAGRVKKKNEEGNLEEFDSVSSNIGVYSSLDELLVFHPEAILPCFVIIYRSFQF